MTFTSCIAYKKGSVYFGMVGTDVSSVNIPKELLMNDVNQSVAFNQTLATVKSMWTNYLLSQGLKYVAGKYFNYQGKVINSDTTIELEKLRNAKSVADANARLKELEIVTPTP